MLNVKITFAALGICAACVTQLQAQAPVHFGFGSGLMRLSSKGDQGFHTNLFGPVQTAFDLDPDDFDDLLQSAIGGGGYVTNGTWMLQFSLAQLKLGGQPAGILPSGGQVSSDLSFDILSGEFLFGYTVYRSPGAAFSLRPHIGARYVKHELASDLRIVDAGTTTDISRAIDHNWTDVLIGTSVDVRLASKLSWSTRGDAGFGGSNGSFSASSGVSWRVLRHLSFGPQVSFLSADFENGTKGDTDWYLYDANEFSWGVSVLFHF
jgi:hypothetical protein